MESQRPYDQSGAPFCTVCSHWISRLGEVYVGNQYVHQPSFEALDESALTCSLCRLVLNRFEETDQADDIRSAASDSYPTVIQFVGLNHKGVLSDQKNSFWKGLIGILVYCGEEGRNDDWMCELKLYADEGNFAATSSTIAGRVVKSSSNPGPAVSLIKQWAEQCTLNHGLCSPTSLETSTATVSLPAKLPTRVIEIEWDATTGKAGNLVIAAKGATGVYATLSHCWGKTQQFTTTAITFADRLRGFQMTQLSKTMQDAIIIARELSIRYLWIDSICIIQDDVADWEKESARMATIYQDAYINLAATASPDGTKGMLFDRVSEHHVQITRILPDSSIKIMSFYAGPARTYYVDPIRQTPLNQRGWVLQERSLSRRIAHFSEHQLFWECHDHFISEDNHYNTSLDQKLPGRTTFHLSRFDVERAGISPEYGSHLKYWTDLVVEYSRKKLTKDSDVFAALAGIAVRVAESTGDTYIAGMWKSTLHANLLWIAVKAPMKIPEQWRAPSWSWASQIGEISYDGHQKLDAVKESVEILESATEWTGKPFSSHIRSGKLIVRGLVEIATYAPEPTDYHLYDIDTYWLRPANALKNGRKYNYNWVVFDGVLPPVDQPIYCLCISTNRNRGEQWVILLERVTESLSDYRRIGTGRIDMNYEEFGDGKYQNMTII